MPIFVKDKSGNNLSVELGAVSADRPATGVFGITQSDIDNELKPFRSIYYGGSTAKTIEIVFIDGSIGSFTNIQPGSILPFQGVRVNNTGTTATNAEINGLL